MAASDVTPLPTVPAGYNPFEYWQLFANMYSNPSPGFGARIVVLLCLISYSLLAAVVLLSIHVIDYRRRNREFWLWRIVRSRNRRFIVGNQHLIAPLFCMFTSAVFIGNLSNTWTGLYKHGSLANDGAWHLAPWSALFLEQWCVSWSALQAFVLVSADSLPTFAIAFSNTAFVSVGIIELVTLVTFVVRGTINGKILWHVRQLLVVFLEKSSATWAANPVISPDTLSHATRLFSSYASRRSYSLVLTKRVLIVFSLSAVITALVNCGALGTVFVVRRQIKLGYSNFAGARTATSILVPVADEAGGRDGLTEPRSGPEMAQVGFSVTPATPALGGQLSLTDLPAGSSRRSSLSQAPSTTSGLGHNIGRAPSRAKVRALATQEDGGVSRERAKNLQRLQRAEADLITTGVAMIALSICVAVLGIWTIVLLSKVQRISWAQYEIALQAGTWIYSGINAISVSIQIWTAWLNLSAPEPAVETPGPLHLSPTGSVAVAIPQARHQPDAAGALSFEGMLASAPATPAQEKCKFNFSRRGSAQSNGSLGQVREEGGELDLSAFAKV